MKLAFADVYRYVADPRSMEVTPEQMLDDAYLTARAKLIDPTRRQQFDFGMPKAGGTIYMSVADERGMMVSFIQSNYMGFGSGIVVPDSGIAMQNRGCGFSMDPKSPNVVEGGKRPFHTIIPAFLTQQVDGKQEAVMSFGVMGGDMQPQGHLQSIVRMLDYGQQPQAACDAPRWKVNRDFTIDIESTLDRDDGHRRCRSWATRSSRSTIRIWTSAPASTSGSSTVTIRTAAMWRQATAVVTGWQRGSKRFERRAGAAQGAPARRRADWRCMAHREEAAPRIAIQSQASCANPKRVAHGSQASSVISASSATRIRQGRRHHEHPRVAFRDSFPPFHVRTAFQSDGAAYRVFVVGRQCA